MNREPSNSKEFRRSSIYKDSTSLHAAGTKSLSQFQVLNASEEKITRLRECHLDDSEIQLKLKVDSGELNKGDLCFLERVQLDEINIKIQNHHKTLNESTPAIDSAIQRNENRGTTSALFLNKSILYQEDDPVIAALKEYEQKYTIKKNDCNDIRSVSSKYKSTNTTNNPKLSNTDLSLPKSKRKSNVTWNFQKQKYTKTENVDTKSISMNSNSSKDNEYKSKQVNTEQEKGRHEENDDGHDDGESVFIGPLQLPINERVQPVAENIILQNRLDLSDILRLERFKEYKAGPPSNVLYIKNLSKEVSICDLAELFCRFYQKEEADVEYKLLQKGRLRGQAFVTFHDEKTATRALHLCNGYSLRGKPMIIQFGRQKK